MGLSQTGQALEGRRDPFVGMEFDQTVAEEEQLFEDHYCAPGDGRIAKRLSENNPEKE